MLLLVRPEAGELGSPIQIREVMAMAFTLSSMLAIHHDTCTFVESMKTPRFTLGEMSLLPDIKYVFISSPGSEIDSHSVLLRVYYIRDSK